MVCTCRKLWSSIVDFSVKKMEKNLAVEKEVSSTNICLHEIKKLYHVPCCRTVFQLSSRLPRLLSPFPKAIEFFLSALISHMERLCFCLPSCWVVSKSSFLSCSSKTTFTPVTVLRACCCCWPNRRCCVGWIMVIMCNLNTYGQGRCCTLDADCTARY